MNQPTYNRFMMSSIERERLRKAEEVLMKPSSDILVSEPVWPLLRSLNDLKNSLHRSIYNYLQVNHVQELSEIDWYLWPTILRGKHIFAMYGSEEKGLKENDEEDSSRPITSGPYAQAVLMDKINKDEIRYSGPQINGSTMFLCPLLSLIVEKLWDDVKLKAKTGNQIISNYATNGALLVVVCATCSRAQQIAELVSSISDSVSAWSRNKLKIRSIMLQGGGNECEYEVPLTNGVEVLIAATPLCLLRMLGTSKTNLERVQYLVFDETNLLLDKYPKQMKAMLSHYKNMCIITEHHIPAQIIVLSSLWSQRLSSFIDTFLFNPVMITTNKLEASFMGRAMHIVHQIGNSSQSLSKSCPEVDNQMPDRYSHLKQIVQSQPVSVNICIFVNRIEQIDQIIQFLKKNDLVARSGDQDISMRQHRPRRQLNLITSATSESDVENIVKKWTSRTGLEPVGLILILEQAVCDSYTIAEIDTVHCCVNFNMPRTPAEFGKRLWFMRRYFYTNSLVQPKKNEPAAVAASTSNLESIGDKAELRELSRSNAELDVTSAPTRIDFDNDVKHNIRSYLFYKNANSEFVDFLYHFLTRVGIERRVMPYKFVSVAKQVRDVKEKRRLSQSKDEATAIQICPFIKSLGKCMNPNPSSCVFRHTMSSEVDQMRLLDNTDGKSMRVPNEGMIKFNVSFVLNTNQFYINLRSYETKDRREVDYTSFGDFDLDFQYYFSNVKLVEELRVDRFRLSDIYAYKDIKSGVFKRIKVAMLTKMDSKIIYELLAHCIDYGSYIRIRPNEMLRIPPKFKELPPQAIEVFVCNIRPNDGDLNWTVPSCRFASDLLAKNKMFVGRVQLGAGNTLWVDPIYTHRSLKTLKLEVINEDVRQELTENQHAVYYPTHMKRLIEIFQQYDIPMPNIEHEKERSLEKQCLEFLNLVYVEDSDVNNNQNKISKSVYRKDEQEELKIEFKRNRLGSDYAYAINYAYLRRTIEIEDQESLAMNKVFVSVVENPGKFYVQSEYSNDLLERLNSDISKFLSVVRKLERQEVSRNEYTTEWEFVKRAERIREHLTKESYDWLRENKKTKSLICLALYQQTESDDGEFYRGEIVNFEAGADGDSSLDKVQVYFPDFGDYSWCYLRGKLCLDPDLGSNVRRHQIYPTKSEFIRILPYQAIECSLESIIKPIETANKLLEWSPESGDELWSLTHDKDNFHEKNLHVYVLEQQIIEENVWSKKYRYNVRLVLKTSPEEIDLAHKLSTVKAANVQVHKSELKRYFEVKKSPGQSSTIGMDANYILHMIKSEDDVNRKCTYMRSMDFRLIVLCKKPVEVVLQTNILQTMCRAIFLLIHPMHQLSTVRYIRKHFLLDPERETPAAYLQTFCECKGLAGLFYLTSSFFLQKTKFGPIDTTNLIELAKNFINDIITHEIVIEFILAREDYIKAVCLRVKDYLGEYVCQEIDVKRQAVQKWMSYLTSMLNHLNRPDRQEKYKDYYFSQKLINIMKDVVEKSKQSNDESVKSQLQELYHAMRLRRQEKLVLGDNVKDSESESELNGTLVEPDIEDKVEHYLQESVTNLAQREKENEESPPPTDLKLVAMARRRSSNSSDKEEENSDEEEAMEMFASDLENLFGQMMRLGSQKNNRKESQVVVNEPTSVETKNDSSYLFPRKITWDQNRRRVNIRLHLTGVTDFRINYTKNSLSIRCNIGELVYGYDFYLYGSIKEKERTGSTSSVTERDPNLEIVKQPEYVQIEFIKLEEGIWPRLLSSLNKPAFIKSEYNNLSSSMNSTTSDEEDEGVNGSSERLSSKKKVKSVDMREFLERDKDNVAPKLVEGRPAAMDDESSSNSDSSSDFEDCINDVKDHGDIRWD